MFNVEHAVPDPNGIPSYGAALWWTAMLMTTLGPWNSTSHVAATESST